MVERFVGLDVSQRLTSVCILDERGGRVWRGKCTTDPAVIAEVVRARAGGPARLGIETGPLTPWCARGKRYRPEPLPLWRMPDAIARIRRLLPNLPAGDALVRFLPEVATEPPEYDLRCRLAVARTLVADLELARQGELTLAQGQSFGDVEV